MTKWQQSGLAGPTRALVGLLVAAFVVQADAPADNALCADRAAIERVYYEHRTGAKPPFEQWLPRAAIEGLVRTDQRKEAALKNAYGIEVTAAQVQAEVMRIQQSTRAPQMLAELQAALGNDPERFARTVARPIVVDRLLREKYANDDREHAAIRRQAEQTRAVLLAGQTNGASYAGLCLLLNRVASNCTAEITWQLRPRPAEPMTPTPDEMEIQQRFGPEARLLSAPATAGRDGKKYFEDLPDALQRVLRVQLRQPGDISAVIELPHEFLLYLCRERTEEHLCAALLSLPKPSLEDWLHQQPGGAK